MAVVSGVVCVGRVFLPMRRVCPLKASVVSATESALAMSAARFRRLTNFERLTGCIAVSSSWMARPDLRVRARAKAKRPPTVLGGERSRACWQSLAGYILAAATMASAARSMSGVSTSSPSDLALALSVFDKAGRTPPTGSSL